MYQLRYTAGALKTLARIPRNIATLIRAKLVALAADPAAATQVKKLKGREGYRLRVGDWRVIYEIDDGQMVIVVVKVGPRGDVYE